MASPVQLARACDGGCGACSGKGPSCSPRAALSLCRGAGHFPHPKPPARDIACQGYVGQGARPAAEYHECDFDWAEHACAVRHLVEAQEAQALELRRLGPHISPSPSPDAVTEDDGGAQWAPGEAVQALQYQGRQQQQQQRREEQSEGRSGATAGDSDGGGRWCRTSSAASVAAVLKAETMVEAAAHNNWLPQCTQPQPQPEYTASEPCSSGCLPAPRHAASRSRLSEDDNTHESPGPSRRRAPVLRPTCKGAGVDAGGGVYEGGRWEEFYRSHPSARFFKERRYLLLEFPELLRCGHVAEIGCGCGSSILPVLKANAVARTTCTDISTTCLAQLREAALAEGISPSRLSVFPADATDPAAAPAFDGIDADALLIMFTLSAVTPAQQAVMLSHAWRALRPGGRLMLRDHGLYDMVQLRIPADQWVGPNLYKRGDGTMAYFFSKEELTSRASAAGFDTVDCKYVTVINRNRKTAVELRRVFVHGIFEKPAV